MERRIVTMAVLRTLAVEYCKLYDVELLSVNEKGFYVLDDDGRTEFVQFRRINM